MDYPSPKSSPSSPELTEILENQTNRKSNDYSLFSDNDNYCASPCSSYNYDIDIDIDTTSERSYTNMNTYINTNNNKIHINTPLSPLESSQQYVPTKKINKKRSYSEVEDTNVFTNLDTMDEEEMDEYLDNIDMDLLPKVKSSSELLIFSALSMKRFKLSNRKSKGERNNYNCFNLNDETNTPKIVELSDDEDVNQKISNETSVFSTNFDYIHSIYKSCEIIQYMSVTDEKNLICNKIRILKSGSSIDIYMDGKVCFAPYYDDNLSSNNYSRYNIDIKSEELIINDILRSNIHLDFYKGLFVNKDEKKVVESDNFSVNFYPGFTISFMETEAGNFLNVTLKNKIIGTQTFYEMLIEKDYTNKKNHEKIKRDFEGRSFKVSYAKKNYKIDEVDFQKNPMNTTINYNGQTITLYEYYQNAHEITIKNKQQPLIVVYKYNSNNEKIPLYFIPELCYISGLDDAATKDGQFMKKLSYYTKLIPNDRIYKTNEFLQLLVDNNKDQRNKN